MHGLTFLLLGLLGASGPNEYSRSLNAKSLDQATLDTEGYGEKKALKREDDGLRITLAPGETETGWKTPQQVRFGGNFSITANLVIKTLPKPAQEDGAAVGIAIAFQDINQPDVTLVRIREPKGAEVYRSIDKAAGGNPMQPQMMMVAMPGMIMNQPGGAPPKPPRLTFPAAGDSIRLEMHREGNVIRLEVQDAVTGQPRYLGQVTLGPNDVAGIKLFAANRNGAEPINVLFRDIAIQADRVTGLGTTVRTIFGKVVYAEPTSIENGILILGGQPKAPAPAVAKPADANKPAEAAKPNPSPASPPNSAAEKKAEASPAQNKKSATETASTTKDAGKKEPEKTEKKPDNADTKTAKAEPEKSKTEPAAPAQPNLPNGLAAFQTPPTSQPKPPEPKAKIPLDELDSIRFERTPGMAGYFLGQVNLDFTMPGLSGKLPEPAAKEESGKSDKKKDDKDTPKKDDKKKDEKKKDQGSDDVLAPPPGTTITKIPKVLPKKNGIRDLNLLVTGLRNVAIKQVMITCQTDKGPASWRLDTSDSQDWPLVVRRSGTESWADLFLEPPAGDCHQKDFTVNITYDDGQAGNTQIKAGDQHSDAKLAIDPKAPSLPPSYAWVFLAGDDKFFGRFEGLQDDTLKLITPQKDHLKIPLARIAGVHFAPLEPKESAESFAKRLKTRGSEDLLLAQTKKGEILAIAGIVERTEEDKLHFVYQGRSRTLPLKQVEGLIMATRPDIKATDDLRPTFTLPGDVVVSGRWKDLDTSVWTIETIWGQELKLPATDVQGVRFLGGLMTYLSDLAPSKVEETPFFGRRLPWRKDVGLLGEPLKMKGQTYERGVAVHSRSVLTYDLNGQYTTFEALVGFDDSAREKGRVDCRVFADDKEIYGNPDLKGNDAPVKLALPVSGVQQLKLQVDFGRDQDIGDRLIWANARLYRRTSSEGSLAASPPRRESTSESAKAAERH